MSGGPAGVVRNRDFLLLWSGNGLSLIGSFGARVAYPILALEISGSPVLAGWVSFAVSIPTLLCYVHAGVVADYANRKRTMFRCQLLGATVSAALTLWIVFDGVALPAVLVTAALLEGVIFSYFSLAEVAAIRDVVPEAQHASAFSLYEMEQPAAILLGRLSGAASVGWIRWFPFAANFLSYVVSAGFLAGIRSEKISRVSPRPATEDSFRSSVRAGFSWVLGSRFITVSTVLTGVANVVFQVTILLLIVQAQQERWPGWVIGVVLAAAGVGGTLGAVAAPWITRRFSPYSVYPVALWAWVVALLPMALTTNPFILAVAWCAVGAVGTVIAVLNTLSRIDLVPPEVLGRVIGIISLITSGAIPLGAALGGYLLAGWSTGTVAWTLPVTVALLALVGGMLLRHARKADEPGFAVSPRPESGDAATPVESGEVR
ncbi:MFS transporter [Embleya sp. NPDC005971]|uniref:MFS transporter n=1 Tax=Embleya sp. NPDC005971 TaxID=3156724 RepID=UPI003406255F